MVRSLGRRGLACDCGEETFFSTTRFSRHVAMGLVYPSPTGTPERFYAWLRERLKGGRYAVLYPMDDGTTAVVSRHLEEIRALVRVPFPPPPSFDRAADKGLAVEAAAAAGLRVPRSAVVAAAEELVPAAASIGYPLVMRPRRGSGGRGVVVVQDEEELRLSYCQLAALDASPLLQEFLATGEKYDVCVLMNERSQPRAVFVQKELRHFPLFAGTSTLQESVAPRPDLVDMSIALLEKLHWQGVAEVEFMVDRDGRPWFMEINPRFWASLQTAISAGVDFPYLYYQLATAGDCPTVREYRTGLRCRWLLPGDIFHFAANPSRSRLDPPFWSFRAPDTVDDIISAEDPGPILGFGLAALRYLFSIRMWRMLLRRQVRVRRRKRPDG